MRRKRGKKDFSKKQIIILVVLFSISILLNVFNFVVLKNPVTGLGTSSVGSAVFEIKGPLEVNITHPYDNHTYNFTDNIYGPYYLGLNTTSSRDSSSLFWTYRLYDVKHNQWFPPIGELSFTPNTTFSAVRWENQLFVKAEDNGEFAEDNVTFFIWAINTAPILGPINDPIYACEESYLNYIFYAEDADEELLTPHLTGGSGIFYASKLNLTDNRTYMRLDSGILSKIPFGQDIDFNTGNKTFLVKIEVNDSANHSDWNQTNITLLEINNPPKIDEIGTKTVWTYGDNSTLFEIINVHDLEKDNFNWGNLSVNATILNSSGSAVNLFNVTFNLTHYFINFSAIGYSAPSFYDVYICANDTGILIPHPQLNEVCNNTGGPQTTCEYFNLTLTNQNRPPTIVDYYPNNSQEINISGGNTAYFNITKYDPDGTIPDSYWTLNGNLIEFDEGHNLTDEFYLNFGCGISGNYAVKAEISDGELNDSINWSFNVGYVACSSPGSSGGGGGGGGVPSCTPFWGCGNWGVCQHAATSLDIGLLSGQDYRNLEGECLARDLDEGNCGFQTRECRDLNNCSFVRDKPFEISWCHYTEKPNCEDRVKNCHNGGCELLVDCGGPCGPCPSCTDGIKNQGEEGADCGGPCPWKCPVEVPLIQKRSLWYVLLLIALIIILIIIIKLVRVLKYKRVLEIKKKEKV